MDIFMALSEGNEQEVIRLLDEDPTLVDTADANGLTLLGAAVYLGHLGMLRLLVQRGANINATGVQEMTGLHWAAHDGHDDIVAFLLDEGAQANSRDNMGTTPLIHASVKGHLAVVRLLVQHLGAQELDGEDDEGWTALHWACQEGHEEVVVCLLEKRAQASKCTPQGATPLFLASIRGQLGVVQLLLQHLGTQGLHARDFEGRTALHCATEEGRCEMVAFLLSKGAQASTRDSDGETPLISASRCGHIGLVHLLFQRMGAPGLEDRDDDGWTALLTAAYWGQDKVLRFLLLAGADHTITDKQGRTARALAEEEDEEQHDDMDKEGKVRCMAVLEWWDVELGRRVVLHRATCLHKAYTMQRDMPTSQVPTYLEARVAVGHAVPVVEVVSPQSQEQPAEEQQAEEETGTSGKRKAASEGGEAQDAEAGEEKEEERYAMLEFVVKALNEALVTELLEGFH